MIGFRLFGGAFVALVLCACPDGGAEQTGRKIDGAVDTAKKRVGEAEEKIKKRVDAAGDAADQAAKRAKEKTAESLRKAGDSLHEAADEVDE